MGDRRACHPGNRKGAPLGRRPWPSLQTSQRRFLGTNRASLTRSAARKQCSASSRTAPRHGCIPACSVHRARMRLIPARPSESPLSCRQCHGRPRDRDPPKGCRRKGAIRRSAWLRARQTNENPPAEEARGVLSQSVARIRGERGAQFALAAGSGWKRADRWVLARRMRKGTPRHGAERDQKGRSTSRTCWP